MKPLQKGLLCLTFLLIGRCSAISEQAFFSHLSDVLHATHTEVDPELQALDIRSPYINIWNYMTPLPLENAMTAWEKAALNTSEGVTSFKMTESWEADSRGYRAMFTSEDRTEYLVRFSTFDNSTLIEFVFDKSKFSDKAP